MLIKFSQILRDCNWPGVWRREYYEALSGGLIMDDTSPGTLMSTTHTVTLQEPSRIRVMAKCSIGGGDNAVRWGSLAIYEGGATLRDRNFATGIETGNPATSTRGGCSCFYEAEYPAGSYAFALYSIGGTANTVTASYVKWSIDVCRI